MNVNGITLDRRGGQFDTICAIQKEVQADILCGQEHNLASDKTQVRSILYSTCRQHWRRSRVVFGATPIPFTSNYKPGRTFIVSAGDVTGRIKHQEPVEWGRWVSQTLQRKGSKFVTIISAYQVVSTAILPGSITATSQQQSLLLDAQDSTLNPHTVFRRDLSQYICQCTDKGHELLLLRNFNEPFGNDPDGMPKLATEIQLIELMASCHCSHPQPQTLVDVHASTTHWQPPTLQLHSN